MSFSQYLTYINPGVQWMNCIPSHWRSGSLRWLSRRFSGGTPDKNIHAYWEGGTIPWLNSGAVNQALITEPSTLISVSGFKNSSAKWIPSGALVMALAGQGKTKGIVAQLAIPSTCNQSMAAIVPTSEMQPRFLLWWLQSNYQNIRNMAGGDMRDGLNLDLLGEIPCPIPPLAEQTAIAGFLDGETTKIDALVEDQKRLIELLKEKRHAVISHAVTKGLNPNAPMKDSGVEWLGKVPVRWQPIQLGRVCRQVSDGPHFSPQYVDEGVMFLSARNLSVNAWHLEDAKFISDLDYLEFSKRVTPEIGDVLYTKGGTTGIARVVDLPIRFQVWVHIAVLKLDRAKSDPYFIAYALNSIGCYQQSQLSTRGATNQDLGLTRMIRIWLALPPLTEQREIASWLSGETQKIDALVLESESILSLLQERRTALISAAVTGKIDVRAQATVTPPKLAFA